jgi:hypothetical protein
MGVRGWVYVLTNKAMPDIVKIGYSTKDPILRAEELEGTGLPHPYVVVYDVLVLEPRDVEQSVHTRLRTLNERKEFFRITAQVAVQSIRDVIAEQNKTVIAETISECVLNETNEGDTANVSRDSSSVLRCPKCGTPVGIKGSLPALIRCSGCGLDFKPSPIRSSLNPAAAWPFPTGSRP